MQALLSYAMHQHLDPHREVEVSAGQNTFIFNAAIGRNKETQEAWWVKRIILKLISSLHATDRQHPISELDDSLEENLYSMESSLVLYLCLVLR